MNQTKTHEKQVDNGSIKKNSHILYLHKSCSTYKSKQCTNNTRQENGSLQKNVLIGRNGRDAGVVSDPQRGDSELWIACDQDHLEHGGVQQHLEVRLVRDFFQHGELRIDKYVNSCKWHSWTKSLITKCMHCEFIYFARTAKLITRHQIKHKSLTGALNMTINSSSWIDR